MSPDLWEAARWARKAAFVLLDRAHLASDGNTEGLPPQALFVKPAYTPYGDADFVVTITPSPGAQQYTIASYLRYKPYTHSWATTPEWKKTWHLYDSPHDVDSGFDLLQHLDSTTGRLCGLWDAPPAHYGCPTCWPRSIELTS